MQDFIEENIDALELVHNVDAGNYYNEIIKELLKTKCYELRKTTADEIRVHSEGTRELIVELLRVKLPTEPSYITTYRLANIDFFGGITKTYFSKVLNTLSRIQRAEDFVTYYKPENTKEHFTQPFQGYQTIEDWYFKYAFKYLLQEPNGYMVVLPAYIQKQIEGVYSWEPIDEYLNLSVTIIPTNKVLYEDSTFIIIEGIEQKDFKVYIILSEYGVFITQETKKNIQNHYNNIINTSYETYTIGVSQSYITPYIKFCGVPKGLEYPKVHESLISGVVPFWNQAIIENSDKQAAVKLHVFPEKWRIKQNNCKVCSGGGTLNVTEMGNKEVICGTCSGTGEVLSAFSEHVYNANSNIESWNTLPFPRVGYIEKDTAMVDYLDKDVRQNILNGLSALNLEFLMDVPLNQSGVAKEYDRQELNTFVYNVAYHAVNKNLLPLLNLIAYTNGIEVKISINIPSNFDFLRRDDEQKLILAINNHFSPTLINLYEKRILEKTFDCFEDRKNIAILVNTHNPFPYRTKEELLPLLEQELITRESLALSSNIESIIKGVYYSNGEELFMKLTYPEQAEIIHKYFDIAYLDLEKKDLLVDTQTNVVISDDEII